MSKKTKNIDTTNIRALTPFLPDNLFVAKTPDRGRAVFTSNEKDRLLLNDTFLYEYYFEWGKSGRKGALALGFGSLYNHSYAPNARYLPDFDLNILEFVAVRDIQPGEEICVNYNLDPDDQTPVWWERDKIKKKKQHP